MTERLTAVYTPVRKSGHSACQTRFLMPSFFFASAVVHPVILAFGLTCTLCADVCGQLGLKWSALVSGRAYRPVVAKFSCRPVVARFSATVRESWWKFRTQGVSWCTCWRLTMLFSKQMLCVRLCLYPGGRVERVPDALSVRTWKRLCPWLKRCN